MGKGKRKKLGPPFPDEMSKMFFGWYERGYWMVKANLVERMLEDPEGVEEIIEGMPLKGYEVENVERLLKAEIHLAEFHCTEALFSLVMAILREPRYPWAVLTTSQKADFEAFLDEVEENGLDNFTADTGQDAYTALFFPYVDKDFPAYVEVQEILDFLPGYFERLASHHRSRSEYSFYKHGNGLALVQSGLEITVEETGETFEADPADSFVFLDTQPRDPPQPGRFVLRRKPIEYERARRIIELNTYLIHNMMEAYRGMLEGSGKINVKTFEAPTLDEIFGSEVTGELRVTETALGRRIPIEEE